MNRYYFHLEDGSETLIDPEGREMSLYDARRQAILICTRIIAEELRDDRDEFKLAVRIGDHLGGEIETVTVATRIITGR